MFSFITGLSLTTLLKIISITAVVSVIGLGAWHYTSVVKELSTTKAALAVSQRDLASAVNLANANAAQALKADQDRKRTVAELEATTVELTASQALARQTESDIDAAPASADGPVAGVLESLRVSRFGGSK
ncbi:hypothetical protein [Rhizobium sp. L245/93]|uniref:hypothetical protein n=1 Tax=Rhizobium sp. L245/93 TaxID=2819998 RepID=UPI001ADB86FE|nr:hypothetical protein [Rhizobium sp. L245/93]MBO9170895.1 hypothetical protein [Rhizobium sp. L245/93]